MTSIIALVGDRDEKVLAHRAIPKALRLAAEGLNIDVTEQWIHSTRVLETDLSQFDGIWCVPASPYQNEEGAMSAIRFAREQSIPFLGTCGGYQYAALEYARNVLGLRNAENQEVNRDSEMPLISPLSCSLVEVADTIHLAPGSFARDIYKTETIEEEYHCRFGVNPELLHHFEESDLRFTGWDDQSEPRVHELSGHPFFIGTAYQPERSAFKDLTHPLITRFVREASKRKLVHEARRSLAVGRD